MTVFTVEEVYDIDDVKLVAVCSTNKIAKETAENLKNEKASKNESILPEKYRIRQFKVI